MATRAVFTPFAAEFPATNFPQLLLNNRRPVLAFDAATSETCYWTMDAPQGLTGTQTAVLSYVAASATTGGVAFDVAVESISSGDATNLGATTSFDTANTGTDAAVPGTAGYLKQISVTLSNVDSMAAADLIRFSLTRNVAHATDTATGDIQVLALEWRDGA